MKIMSNDAVTKQDLSDIDTKQTRQIKQLRYSVGGAVILNVITLALLVANLPSL